jgi:hypothetical protein
MFFIPLSLILFLFPFFNTSAQFSIKEKDILYKKRLVRSVPLAHLSNVQLFGDKNLLVTVLLEAFEKGELKGYQKEDCLEELPFYDFKKKIEYKSEDSTYYTDYKLLNLIEIGEDLIVDKHRSEIIFDMETITVFIPEKYNYREIREPLVTFKYDDCVKIFKKDNRANAINPLRNGRNLNFAEVLLLKLYISEIVRIGDHTVPYFDQMCNDPLQAFLLRKNAENELTEMLYRWFNPK